jgi:prepilin-type N-terminal cleavage/methylation domain-containing protein
MQHHTELPTRRRGFTLIEMMAVVLLMALMISLFIPDFGLLSRMDLREQTKLLAANIELARQRAIITGRAHRLVLDLDAAAYYLEWRVQLEAAPIDESLSISEQQALLIAPPPLDFDFEPVPTIAGNLTILREPLFIEGVETAEGWIDNGIVYLFFEEDGTTESSTIILTDDAEHRRALTVLPLAEAVRISDAS